LSKRSRDQLPNPIEDSADPYIPANRPAIGDLRGLFQF
jgi:phospholipase C